MQERKNRSALAQLHAECERNFWRLHRLLPNTQTLRAKLRLSPEQGGPRGVELTVVEVTRYTSLVHIVSVQQGPDWLDDIDIQVRVYRDARMAEVVEWCRDRTIPWALCEPSKLYARDEKWQWNLFLSELLSYGLGCTRQLTNTSQ